MALSAKAAGFRIAVLDPVKGCPCGQVADYEITGAYDDLSCIEELAGISDVITYEFENISAAALDWLDTHAYLPQGAQILRISQNRLFEKAAVEAAGVPVAPYYPVRSMEDFTAALKKAGMPSVLKTATGGYDGKGQLVIRSEEDIEKAGALISQGDCVLESWVPFEKELSVIVARSTRGETACFPVAENIHRNNILHQSIVPARIAPETEKQAVGLAVSLAENLELIGTLAVEMFLTEDGRILVNELAPRPHNSGHYTIEGCETSQFEQHIRAVCGWPLGSTRLVSPAVMANLLGEHLAGALEAIPDLKDWKLHIYGKDEAKHKRKMGHITLLRPAAEAALDELEQSGIWEKEPEMEEKIHD